MAITEVLCINSDKDFKVTDSGFALTQVYKYTTGKIRPELEFLTYLPTWKALPKSLYSLTQKFLSLLWCYLNHFSDVTGTTIRWLNMERFDWWQQFLVSWYHLVYTKHTRPFMRRGRCHQTSLTVRVWFYNVCYVVDVMWQMLVVWSCEEIWYCIMGIMEFRTFSHFIQKLALQARNCCDDVSIKLLIQRKDWYVQTSVSQ